MANQKVHYVNDKGRDTPARSMPGAMATVGDPPALA